MKYATRSVAGLNVRSGLLEKTEKRKTMRIPDGDLRGGKMGRHGLTWVRRRNNTLVSMIVITGQQY